LTVLLLAGCSSSAQNTPRLASGEIPRDLLITLERTRCYGRCPHYKLSINAEGEVIFEGIKFTRADGKTEKHKISREKLKELLAEFEKADYFAFEDEYSEAKNCQNAATDHPWANTSLRFDGKSKAVKHYLGCVSGSEYSAYPKPLLELEKKIDEIAETARFLKSQSEL
jgi:hypothetical protein